MDLLGNPLTLDASNSAPPLGADDTTSELDAAGPGPKPRRRPPATPQPVQASTFVAAQRDPARWAKVLDVAKRYNVQPAYADRNFDELSKADDKQRTDQQIAGVSPTLANWLSDPDNATIGKHELAPLTRVDSAVKTLAPAPRDDGEGGFFSDAGNATATGMADLGAVAGLLGVVYGHTSPKAASRFVADQNQRATFLRDQAPNYAKEFSAAMEQHANDVDAAINSVVAAQPGQRRASIRAALGQFLAHPIDSAPAAGRTLGEVLELIGAAASRPRGLAYQGLESLASMAPMIAGAAAGGTAGAAAGGGTGALVGSVGGPIGAAVGGTLGAGAGGVVGGVAGTFAGMAPVNVGSEINAELRRRGIDVTDSAQLERAFSDPVLMGQIRTKAQKAGLTNAAVVSLFSSFAGRIAGMAEESGLPTKIAAKAADVGVQAGGMGVAQAAGQAASGEKVSAGQAMSTAISMLGVSGAMEAIGESRRAAFHADPVEAAVQATAKANDALRAHRDAQALEEIGAAVKEATTTSQLPDRVKALVETATGGQDAGSVFFQSSEWDKFWTAQGRSPAEAAAEIMGDGGRAYHDAQTTGEPLAIALGDYVSKVAPTEHWEPLLEHARTAADGMTLGEAKEYLQSLPATMMQIANEANGTAAKPAEASKTSGIREQVEAQLLTAGRPKAEAKAAATQAEAVFRTLGQRAGIDPVELFNRYKLAIGKGERPAARPVAPEPAAAPAAPVEPQTDAAIEQRFRGQLEKPEAVSAYAKLKETANGKILNVDLARELSSDYAASNEARGRLAPVIHEPSSEFIQRLWKERLQESPTGPVLLMAGGGGSGKSVVMGGIARHLVDGAEIVRDAVLGNQKKAVANIDDALASGRTVDVVYVHTPFREAHRRAVLRAGIEGRSVPQNELAHAHAGAQSTILHLAERYADNPNVRIHIIDNSLAEPREISVASLAAERYAPSGEEVGTTAARLLEEATNAQGESSSSRPGSGSHDAGGAQGAPEGAPVPAGAPGSSGLDTAAGVQRDAGATDDAGRAASSPRGASGSGAVVAAGADDGSGRAGVSGPPLRAEGSSPEVVIPGPVGRSDQVHFPDGSTVETRYRVIEADELQASHDPFTFNANTAYPAGVQGREYSGSRGKAAREHVEAQTGKLDTRVIDAGSGLTDGPPLVTPEGIAVAGNQRAMMLKRAWSIAGDKANAVRDALIERAPIFGLNADEIRAMRNPVLVREITDPSIDVHDPQTLSRLNQLSDQTSAKSKDALSAALGRAKALQGAGNALQHFADTIGADDSIRDYLGTAAGTLFVRKLFEDGVIAPQERGAFVDAQGHVTATAKEQIEAMLRVAAIGDPDVIHRAPPSILKKLETAIPAIIQANRTGAYDLTSDLQGALALLGRVDAMKSEMQARGERIGSFGVADYMQQQDMFGGDTPPEVVDVARFLESRPRAAITAGFREYAKAALAASDASQSDDLFGHAPASQPELRARLTFDQADTGAAEPRGRIMFGEHGVSIDLLEKADRSTFLHETGHLYLKVLEDLAKVPDAAAGIVADHATVREWLGAEAGAELTRDQHEQFARGFEAYLMEGKAPSNALRKAFYHFRQWLTRIYKDVSALNVTLTPEVRAVFDRLLATDAEIAQAERAQNVQPLFVDPAAAGMTPAAAKRYLEAAGAAHQAAVEQLSTKMMADVRREQSAEWKVWRTGAREEVAAEVNARPVYKALEYLRRGTAPDGTPLPEGTPELKLSRESIVATYGKEFADKLPRGILASAENGGTNADLIAEMFGFDSGKELVNAIAAAGPREQTIEFLTDQKVRAEHGERPTPAEIKDAAAEAVRGGEKRVQLLRLELEHLMSDHLPAFKGILRAIDKRVPPSDEVKRQATAIIAGKKVREIRPDLLEHAANRAADDAREALLRGDVAGALEAKRREILATEVLNAARLARDNVDTALEDFKKIFRRDDKLSGTRDINLVNAARAILSAFGIGSSDTPPGDYLAQMREYDPQGAAAVDALVADALLRGGGSKDYRDLAAGDFADLAESVRSLWNRSRTEMQVTIDGKRQDRRVIQEQLAARATDLRGTGELPGTSQQRTQWQGIKAGLLSWKAVATKLEHWVRAMDAGASDGIFRRYVWNPISEAADAFRVAKKATATEYADFLRELQGRGDKAFPITRDKIPAPELNYTFAGHNELLGALLHTGNESNLRKNLVGRHWGNLNEDGSLDRTAWDAFTTRMRKERVLTKAHYDFIQGVWDRFEKQKPDAQRAHFRMYGRYFDEVTRDGFTNEFGAYAGGYFPAKADPTIVSDKQAQYDRDALLGSSSASMFPSVGKGFTIRRIDRYMKPLIMDASAVPQQLDAVLRFTHLGPTVQEVHRVITDRGVHDALHALDPAVLGDALIPWIKRAAQQRAESAPEGGDFRRNMAKVASRLRNSAALQIMTVNSVVLLEQLTHFPSVFVRVKPGDLASAVWRYTTDHKAMASDIAELSPMMRTRESAGLDAAREEANKILLDPTAFETVRNFAHSHGRFLMAGIQSVMDHVVWSAVYDRAMETMTPKESARHADATVRELLGSYSPEDVTRIEAGTPVEKLFTMFAGFFLTKGNVLATESSIAKQLGVSKNKGRLAAAAFWGFAIPAMMGLGIKNVMAGKGVLDQEDDEGTLHALLSFFGESTFEMGARMIPYGGQALTVLEHTFSKGRREDLLNSPAIKMAGDALRAPADVVNVARGGDLTRTEITDFLTLVGMLTDLPIRPLAKPLGYLSDVYHGKAAPTGPIDTGRGLVTGQAGGR